MIKIPIVNTDLFALIDDEDYEKVKEFKWYLGKNNKGKPLHVQSKLNTKEGRKSVYLHRIIMDAPKGIFVDHINHNIFDNQKANLRLCNNQNNCFNRRSTNPTGYKGVFLRKEKRFNKPRYRSYINIDGKRTNLGTFDTAEQAALAYNEAAIKYHGEFAYLNDIK